MVRCRNEKSMLCISESIHRGMPHWRVSIRRGSTHFQKRFPFHLHGGREMALEKAKAWRDEIVSAHPVKSKLDMARQMRPNNTSGTPGVYRRKAVRKKRGKTYVSYYWQAIAPGRANDTRSFSIKVYGEDGAYRKAVDARKEFEAELEAAPKIQNAAAE